MEITRLRLANFRSYEMLDLRDFDPGINVIRGPNAQGKTNLLEAMYACANGKSFRFTQEKNFIRDGAQSAYIGTTFQAKGSEHRIEMMIGSDRRKSCRLDGAPVRTIREIIGNLLIVSFSPEDIRTANEGPQLRRSLLDIEISKIRPTYVDALKQYARIIQDKNRILKRPDAPETEKLLRAYNAEAVPFIRVIERNRRRYVENLNEYVAAVQQEISSGNEKVVLSYKAGLDENRIAESLAALEHRERSQMCSVAGPHRDDLAITLNGKDVRQYASQGQLRSVMLSIKIACVRALRDATEHTPVLILDDVFSELDAARKNNLLSALSDMQVFITSADPEEIPLLSKYPQIAVENGRAVPVR